MALSRTDAIPEGIPLRSAYSKIRQWYQKNSGEISSTDDEYHRRSTALIDALPSEDSISEPEMRAVLQEVIFGLLEWGWQAQDLWSTQPVRVSGC